MFDLRKVGRDIKDTHGPSHDIEHKIAVDESKRIKIILDTQGERVLGCGKNLNTDRY